MRLLFVSSTTVGGSGRSQRELARLLTQRGHQVHFLVDDDRPFRLRRWSYEQLSDVAARWGERPGSGLTRRAEQLPGRRMHRVVIDGWEHRASPVPENAFRLAFEQICPDVVVGNSIIRLAWRKIRAECARQRVPTVLYVREVSTYLHLDAMDDPADVLVANAESLAEGARKRGFECRFVPSVVDVAVTRTESERSAALLVNPSPMHGLDLLWQLAERLPNMQFEIRESWPLDPSQLANLERKGADLANVRFERRAEPGPELYQRARVLLTPHRIDNRPRVVVEAQANGIPVIASDEPGLREVVGPGGVILAADDLDAWARTLERMWTDKDYYDELQRAALAHGERSEIQPLHVVDQFEQLVAVARERWA